MDVKNEVVDKRRGQRESEWEIVYGSKGEREAKPV